jgi:squalene synthase HpnC
MLPGSLPPEVAAPLARGWTVDEAYAYCTRLTKAHYENFPVGSILAPAALQPAIHSLYAFMRTADDFSDENRRAGDEAERMVWLTTWQKMLNDCEAGVATHPIFIALQATLERYQLPVEWLRDLLHAFTMDVTVRRYAAYADVLTYCRYSANPVGRLILALSGYRDEELYGLSDAICTGLQLANHWQDVAVDLEKDRIYLPQDDLARFGVSVEQLERREFTPAFRDLLELECGRAWDLFRIGHALPERVRGRLRWELRFTWLGGTRILEKIENLGYDTLHHRPVVGRLEWGWIALKTILGPSRA